jgi:hypothetical protein
MGQLGVSSHTEVQYQIWVVWRVVLPPWTWVKCGLVLRGKRAVGLSKSRKSIS